MPNYSSGYRFELPLDGERSGTWGQMMNTFMGTLLEDALSGGADVSMTSDANRTLTTASAPAQDEARRLVLNVTSTVSLTVTRDIIIPNSRKIYSIRNGTTGAQAIRAVTSTSTISVTIPNGARRFIFCDGTNTYDMFTDLPTGASVQGVPIVTTTASQTLTNKTLDTPVITSPTLTVRDNVFTVQDELDNTKQARLQLSGVTTATTRTLTVPDTDGTLALIAATQNLTNKTLDNSNTLTVRDDRLTIQDSADTTKQVTLELSGLTTASTRIMSVADGNFTIGGRPMLGTSAATYSVTAADRGDMIVCYSGCTTVAFPNPAAVGATNNFYCTVYNNTGGNVTFTTAAGVFVVPSTGYPASYVLPNLMYATVTSDGTNWWIETPIPTDLSITTAKLAAAAVTPAKISQPFTQMTPRTMSGTQQDWTGIPSWANRITIGLVNASLNQNTYIRLQAGSGSVDQTNTYVTAVTNLSGWLWSGNGYGWDLTDGGSASGFYTGIVQLLHMGSNLWAFNVTATTPTLGPTLSSGSGYKTLSGALDRLRLTSYNGSGGQGTASFDAGTVTVYYE
jgi:hypothetical protein